MESVIVGFHLGLIRGVTGVLDCLSHELRGKIIESHEARNKFHDFHKSVDKLSTSDALTVFGDDLSKEGLNMMIEKVAYRLRNVIQMTVFYIVTIARFSFAL